MIYDLFHRLVFRKNTKRSRSGLCFHHQVTYKNYKTRSAASIEWSQFLSPDKSDKSNVTERRGFIFFAFCGMTEADTASETMRLVT